MVRNRSVLRRDARHQFGERLEDWDRECLARSRRHVDFVPVAGLRDFARTMIEVLWGIGFATHVRRTRGLSHQGTQVCPERIAELAWSVYYSSWCVYPEGDVGPVSGAGR